MSYSDKVIDHYENPRNVGILDKDAPNVGTGMVGAPACFVGDTVISTPEFGGGITLKDMHDRNLPLYVWSYNTVNSKFELKQAKSVKTGTKQTVVLTMDDGATITCTADHKFLTYNSSYTQCCELVNISLKSFSKIVSNNGYWQVNRDVYEHSHYAKLRTNRLDETFSRTFNVDHINEDKRDNSFANLSIMSISEHNHKSRENRKPQTIAEQAINYNHKIISINPGKVEDVYCLQVEENNNFIVLTSRTLNCDSGIVVKNCGDVMRLQIQVEDDVITDAKFKTYGCGSAIASSSLLTEWVKGKTLEEAAGIKNSDIAEELCLPP